MTTAITKCWTFASTSGRGRYQTLLYADGKTSCSCPGWCRRVATDGSRSCKHTRSVLMNTANRECLSQHEYLPAQTPANIAVGSHATSTPLRSLGQFGQMGQRKIHGK